jgi:hypothetical protein
MEKNPLTMLAISDTGFVFDPRTGHSYTVNSTGLALLRSLKQGFDVTSAQEQLEGAFDCSGNITSDIHRFINALINNEILNGRVTNPVQDNAP